MTTRAMTARISTAVPGFVVAILAALLIVLVTPALGADGDFRPVLRPVDHQGSYFDLQMEPGQTRLLTVEVGNDGSDLTAVRTYAADTYTIINGGFGARLFGEPKTGATLWLDYADEIIELPAARSVERRFRVSVPVDAGPGEYLSSLVVENRDPILGTGQIAINQVLRQAVAVVVSVPGTRQPGLEIGAAEHVVAADRSFVRIGLRNSGNSRLRPTAQIRIADATGGEIVRGSIPMDSFYAFTNTFLEIGHATRLAPGSYSVDVSVVDEVAGVRAEASGLPFTVVAPASPSRAALPPVVAEIIEAVGGGDPVTLLVIVAALLGATVTLALLVRFRYRRRHL